MECSCSIDVGVDEDDCVKVFKSKITLAKKTHYCLECRETIDPNKKYLSECYLSAGRFYIHKTCWSCYKVRKVLFKDGFFYSMLWDNINDSISEGMEFSEKCIADLPKPARARLCNLIEAHWRDE